MSKRSLIWDCVPCQRSGTWSGANPGSAEVCISCGAAPGEARAPSKKKSKKKQPAEESESSELVLKPVSRKKKQKQSAAAKDYSKLKVVDLKAELKKRGLKVGGRKADLVARLKEDDAAKK